MAGMKRLGEMTEPAVVGIPEMCWLWDGWDPLILQFAVKHNKKAKEMYTLLNV